MNLQNAVLSLGILLLLACTTKGNLPSAAVYPVKWFPGFTMAQWLVKKAPMHDQEDVQALLDKRWDYPVKLIHLQTRQVFTADRCSQILPTLAQLETYRPSEFRPFSKQAAMCVAAESIAKARPAKHSALSTFRLGADFPRQAPKNLALVISSARWKRISQNKEIVSWTQVETVKFVSSDSAYHAKYAMDGAFQEVLLIARGDFNHDNIEDILLFATAYVVGGTYAAYRLFWITKINTNSPITLIREYPPDIQ